MKIRLQTLQIPSNSAAFSLLDGAPPPARRFDADFAPAGPAFEIFQNRQPFVAPIGNRGEQPLLPVGGFGGGKFPDLSREPAFGIGPRLRVVVQAQNQRADFFVARAAVSLNQALDRRGEFVPAFVLLLQCLVQRLVGQQPRLALVEHGGLRVEAQLVKMFAHELETKTVERADVRGVEQRELLGKKGIAGIFPRFFLQHAAEALFHFRGGGFGEGDDENFIQRGAFVADAIQAAFDERVRLAGARAGHDQHVAARGHGLLLRWRQRIFGLRRRFHFVR